MSKHTASTGSSSETLSHLHALKKAFQVAQHVGTPVTVYWSSGVWCGSGILRKARAQGDARSYDRPEQRQGSGD
jgi:hypothetical protein